MKKNASSVQNNLTDQNIDQFCSSIEKLLKNIKSKTSKPLKNDFMLDRFMFDDFLEE
jgi:hypothetical protein